MDFSVVVPCYNHERYVATCLQSIDAQDVDGLEIIVIDDGSKDGSWTAIEAFKFNPRHKVKRIRTPNRGAHAALNLGIAQSSGKWIALCNSDDLFGPGRLSALRQAATESGARFAFSKVWYVDGDGRDVTSSSGYAAELKEKQDAITTFPSVGWSLIPTNVAISTGNFFFERSLVAEVGAFRPYRLVHDWDFVLRALLLTEPIYVPQSLYGYRLHGTNSFTGLLGEVAARECPELMRRYWKAASGAPPQNRLAPSNAHWPYFCETFLKDLNYEPYLVGWEAIDPPFYEAEPVPAPT
jgi:glycosyltransferase involved in cell wall biosynthesis